MKEKKKDKDKDMGDVRGRDFFRARLQLRSSNLQANAASIISLSFPKFQLHSGKF